MQSEDVCPLCESTNTSGKDWDNDIYGRRLQYMNCNACGCRYVVKWEEIIDEIEILEL